MLEAANETLQVDAPCVSVACSSAAMKAGDEEQEHNVGVFYSLEMLTGERWKEINIDGPTSWKHLHDKEFVDLFGMSNASFSKLTTWRQTELKKRLGLF